MPCSNLTLRAAQNLVRANYIDSRYIAKLSTKSGGDKIQRLRLLPTKNNFARSISVLGEIAERAVCHRGLQIFTPAQIVAAGLMFARFANRHVGNGFDDPFEIRLAD